MTGRYAVSLNEIQMDTLDDNLLILDVRYPPLERTIRKNTNANLDGYDIGETHDTQRTVTVTFELHIYDLAERNKACQKVNDWAANGGILRINDREDQFLYVTCDTLAEIESARNWTDPLTLVFTSSFRSYWISDEPVIRTLTGTTQTGTIEMDGNTNFALVSVEATAQGSVTSFSVTVGSTTLSLTGISVTNGQKIEIDYLRERFLRIRANGASVMNKLTASSSDNLRAECGKTSSISFTANNKLTVVFTARGCWR